MRELSFSDMMDNNESVSSQLSVNGRFMGPDKRSSALNPA